MQAIVHRRYGSPEVLSLEELELPALGDADVRVRVRAASINAWDAAKLHLLTAVGADHVLDFEQTDYTRSQARYDFILDCELHRSPLACLRVLAPGGKLTVLGGANLRILETALVGLGLRLGSKRRADVLMHQANKDLAHLAKLAAAGDIRPAIEREYSLAEVPLALQRTCDGLVAGKAVICIA